MTQNLFVKSWGCQMNVYDSDRMVDVLATLGYRITSVVEDADMVVLNTCHIREKATEKLFSDLGRFRQHKEARQEQGKDTIIAVAGCVAQAEGREITDRAPFVDMVFGPQTYHELPDMIQKLRRHKKVIHTDFPAESKFDFLPEEFSTQAVSAFLSIQEGCDKFCTFCVVPYTRGAEFSRPVADILKEARTRLKNGTREITLLGQNVNAFHGEGPDGKSWGLGQLIHELADLEGLERLRYTTSHPKDMDEDLILAHKDVPQLMPYLHLPVQSGSDSILTAMNRKHTAESYRRIIDRLRTECPDIALSSDFIVGFPGETAQDFVDTLRLITDIDYAQAYSFKYSQRPGTPADGLDDQVPEEVKSERLESLQTLLNAQQAAFNQKTVGKTVPVLFDRKGKRNAQIQGRTPHMQTVNVEGPESLLGQTIDIVIESASSYSLKGRITGTDES